MNLRGTSSNILSFFNGFYSPLIPSYKLYDINVVTLSLKKRYNKLYIYSGSANGAKSDNLMIELRRSDRQLHYSLGQITLFDITIHLS